MIAPDIIPIIINMNRTIIAWNWVVKVSANEPALRYDKDNRVSQNPKNEVSAIKIADMKYGLRFFSPRSRTFEYSDKK